MADDSYAADFDAPSRTLRARGVVDEAGALALRAEIQLHSDHHSQPLSVDLSRVDYLPSSAVGVLATARREAHRNGTELVLRAEEGTLAQRVLVVCGLDHQTSEDPIAP